VRHRRDRDYLLHHLRKAWWLIALVVLILLGSMRLFSSLHVTTPPLRPPAAPMARPSSAVNSTSAMFGFDLPHTHVNPSERILSAATVSHLVPAWISHPGDVINSSPAIANEVVYIGSDDGKLYAFDARTGTTRWRYFIGGVSNSSFLIDSSPAVIHGMIYIGSRDHKVFAFHLLAGAVT
jgi:hypothetical protein